MPFVWSMPNIRKLAPDGLTMNRAMGIFFAGKWEEIGGNEKIIWAKYPYYRGRYFKTVVRLDPLEHYCSCRSKAMPCKHVLGLLVQLYRDSSVFFISSQTPPWVAELLSPAPKPKKQKAKAPSVSTKTVEERKKIMRSGIGILEKWLRQLIRHGLAEAQGKPLSYWDEIAAQLVDSKLGGIAKRIRTIKEFIHTDEWETKLIFTIGELHLFCNAFRKQDKLSEQLSADIDNYAGISTKRGVVLKEKGVTDHWYVLGQFFGEEEQIAFRRTWLWGIKSGIPILNLAFSWGGQPYLHNFQPGQLYHGKWHFYPSAYPLRAVTDDIKILPGAQHHPAGGYENIEQFLKHYATAKALNPILLNFPILFHWVIPHMNNETLTLQDRNGNAIQVTCEEETAWQILAFSGGWEITFFGEWEAGQLTPLGVWCEERAFFINPQ